MAGSKDDTPPPPPPPSQTPTQQTPHTISTIKLPILMKGEYDIWAMKMEHYLAHTDYPTASPLKMQIKNSLGLYLLSGLKFPYNHEHQARSILLESAIQWSNHIVSEEKADALDTLRIKDKKMGGDRLSNTELTSLVQKNDKTGCNRMQLKLSERSLQRYRGFASSSRTAKASRIEAIKIFLAFASYMGFIVYHMDVKSVFLYGKIDEEVYVSQPPGFVDPKVPKKSGYIRGTIDKTLFIKKDKNDIMSLPKTSYLMLKENLRYLKQTQTGPFGILELSSYDLEAYSDSAKRYKGGTDDNVADHLTKHLMLNRTVVAILVHSLLTESYAPTCKVIPLGKDSTAIETLEKIFAKEGSVIRKGGEGRYRVCVEIISFLTRSSIHYALTVSPVVSTTFVEQFWMSAKSKIINNVEYITANVAGKPVSISEASIRKGSGGNHGGQSSSDRSLLGNEGGMTLQSVYDLCISLCTQVTDQAKEIKHLKAQIKKLKKKAKPVITHHKAWMKSVSMKQRLAGKKSLKKQWMQKESVSKQGRKPAKAEPTVHKDPAFDELDDDTMDYMETEDAQDVGRTSYVVHEEKESAEKGVSTEDPLSTAQPKVSTDKPKDSTNKLDEAPTTTTPIIFGDDETIAQVLIIMSQNKEKLKEKEKRVELKDVEETGRPRPTSTRSLLTLKPLPKIDLKDKGKKIIEEEDESDTDLEDITEAEKKFKQLAMDEEVAKKVQEDWEAEEEVKKLAKEEATKAALSNEYDFIHARLNADKILAEKLQEEEREIYTIEQRAKFLHDTIVAQRRFLAQQRSEAIRNKLLQEISLGTK
ncbi:ribonuclease H-like domain-containing protein [Tanacetum coccineum]